MAKRERDHDFAYMAFVRARACAIHGMMDPRSVGLVTVFECFRAAQAHHAGTRGLGQRAPDRTCIPLCARHHRDLHDATGVFLGWSKAQRREWQDERIAEMQALYASHGARRGVPF